MAADDNDKLMEGHFVRHESRIKENFKNKIENLRNYLNDLD